MKTYREHNCGRRHRSFNTAARCIWSRAEWVSGEGPYATVAYCRVTTVMLHATLAEAETAKRVIDVSACGGLCRQAHEVIRLAPTLAQQPSAQVNAPGAPDHSTEATVRRSP